MIHEVNLGRSCDSLQRYQNDVIQADTKLIDTQDSLLEARKRQILMIEKKSMVYDSLYVNEILKGREQKRETRKWKAIGIAGIAVIVLQFIFHP